MSHLILGKYWHVGLYWHVETKFRPLCSGCRVFMDRTVMANPAISVQLKIWVQVVNSLHLLKAWRKYLQFVLKILIPFTCTCTNLPPAIFSKMLFLLGTVVWETPFFLVQSLMVHQCQSLCSACWRISSVREWWGPERWLIYVFNAEWHLHLSSKEQPHTTLSAVGSCCCFIHRRYSASAGTGLEEIRTHYCSCPNYRIFSVEKVSTGRQTFDKNII